RLIRCVCGKKIGPDPRNFNQRVSLGRNDLLIRTFHNNWTGPGGHFRGHINTPGITARNDENDKKSYKDEAA
ncbi:TPA: hypothetical protein ACS9RA_005819, partial [Klebsiella pneumoniae]